MQLHINVLNGYVQLCNPGNHNANLNFIKTSTDGREQFQSDITVRTSPQIKQCIYWRTSYTNINLLMASVEWQPPSVPFVNGGKNYSLNAACWSPGYYVNWTMDPGLGK